MPCHASACSLLFSFRRFKRGLRRADRSPSSSFKILNASKDRAQRRVHEFVFALCLCECTFIYPFTHSSFAQSLIYSLMHSLTHSLTRKPVGPWQSRIANGLAAGLHHSCVETLFRVSKITEHVHDHDHAHHHHQYRHDHIIHHPQGELSVATCSIFKSGHRRDVMCRYPRLPQLPTWPR